MDTSEKYIKMCSAAEEIQKEWKPSEGDYYSVLGNPRIYALGQWRIGLDPEDVWLPRQDQLQDLFDDNLKNILEGFYDYMTVGGYDYECPEFDDTRCEKYGSMEQLWLAYLMEVKYDKRWDGKTWISLNKSSKPLFLQIYETFAEIRQSYIEPKIIVMSSETLKDLDVISICGLRIAIDPSLEKGKFQIMGGPL